MAAASAHNKRHSWTSASFRDSSTLPAPEVTSRHARLLDIIASSPWPSLTPFPPLPFHSLPPALLPSFAFASSSSFSRCHWCGKWVTTVLNQSQVTCSSEAGVWYVNIARVMLEAMAGSDQRVSACRCDSGGWGSGPRHVMLLQIQLLIWNNHKGSHHVFVFVTIYVFPRALQTVKKKKKINSTHHNSIFPTCLLFCDKCPKTQNLSNCWRKADFTYKHAHRFSCTSLYILIKYKPMYFIYLFIFLYIIIFKELPVRV